MKPVDSKRLVAIVRRSDFQPCYFEAARRRDLYATLSPFTRRDLNIEKLTYSRKKQSRSLTNTRAPVHNTPPVIVFVLRQQKWSAERPWIAGLSRADDKLLPETVLTVPFLLFLLFYRLPVYSGLDRKTKFIPPVILFETSSEDLFFPMNNRFLSPRVHMYIATIISRPVSDLVGPPAAQIAARAEGLSIA